MRKVIGVAVVVGLAIATGATPAAARTATKFDVYAIGTSTQRSGASVILRDRLVEPADRDDVVGHDVVRCRFRRSGRSHCKSVSFFRDGKVKAVGSIGGRDHRLPVVGGTGAFNGVSGKLIVHSLNTRNSLLTFVLVS